MEIASSVRTADIRTSHYLREICPYFRHVLGELILGAIGGIAMNTAAVLPAILLGRAVDRALAYSRGEATLSQVGWAAAAIVLGSLATDVPRVAKRWFLATANTRIRANLRADAVRGVLAWPMSRLMTTPIGDLMARINGDIEVVGQGVREFVVEMWDTVLFSITLVATLVIMDAQLSLLALSPVPAAMLVAYFAGRWVSRRTHAARAANAVMVSSIQERLTAARLLRLLGRTQSAVDQVQQHSQAQAQANLALVRLRSGLQPVYATLMTLGVIMVIWLGGRRVITGALTLGTFIAYIELYRRFVDRAFRVPQLINSVQSGGAAYERVRPLLASPPPIEAEPRYSSFTPGHVAGLAGIDESPVPPCTGPAPVSVQDMVFAYPGASAAVLADVSFDVPAGGMLAITGPVGSGKSALARALIGIYPLQQGRICVDGRPVEQFSAADRASRIAYLPEDSQVFSGAVHENILMGRADGPAMQSYIDAAARAASLDEDVQGFPEGMATQIGELGVRVSGGQRQRIALARAIAAAAPFSPGLLVLDDPFSAVDVQTEARIIAALRELFGPSAPPDRRATIVLVSHRLAAFPLADRIIVLQQGRIAQSGTHGSLMHADGLYRRIFLAQHRTSAATGQAMPLEVTT